MEKNLVGGRLDFSGGDENLEVVNTEVANTDAPVMRCELNTKDVREKIYTSPSPSL